MTSLVNKKENRLFSVKIYYFLFVFASFYILACKLYMDDKNYDHLLTVDSWEVFIPMTEYYLNTSKGLLDALSYVWDDYFIFKREMPGYYTILIFGGWLSEIFKTDLYLTLQLSTLFLASFIGVVLYRLFLKNGFDQKESYKNTLIISFLSVLFFYSTIILRDSHIALLYLVAIYLTFKKEFSIVTVVLLLFVSIVTGTLRSESGLFLLMLIPLYLFMSLQVSKHKILTFFMSFFVVIMIIYLGMSQQEEVKTVYDDNRKHYIDADKGGGVIGSLDSIPLVGKMGAIVYNAVLPIPCWRLLKSPSRGKAVLREDYRREVYNIMNFPRIITAFLNWLVLLHICAWLLSQDLRKRTKNLVSKPLFYQLLSGLLFFYLQATVLSHRRLMGYYCVFYILFFIIYRVFTSEQKRVLMFWTIFSFLMLQVFGVVYEGGL